MRQNGIALEGDKPLQLPKVKATDDPATIGKVDMVIFAVKLRDTETAARAILPILGPDTGIISLQNGVQKDDMLAPIVGRKALLGGAAYIGVSIVRPGVIRKTGAMERLAFGEYDNKVSPRAQAFLDACKAGGINADIPRRHHARAVAEVHLPHRDVERHGLDALDHRSDPRQSADACLRARHHEGSRRGRPRARRRRCRRTSPSKRIGGVDALAPDMQASMALDLQLGRPLELPWLAGAVVDLGAAKGVPTPCCRAVRDILALYVDGKPADSLPLIPANAGIRARPQSVTGFRLRGMSGEVSAASTPASAASPSARTSATSSSLQSGCARSTLSVPMHWPSLTRGTLTQECSPSPKMIAWSSNDLRMPSSPALTSTRCSVSTLRLQSVSRFGLRPPTG